MHIVDLTLVIESVLPVDIKAVDSLFEFGVNSLPMEVIKVLDSKVSQSETTRGNNVIIARVSFEYPSGMISEEVNRYVDKVTPPITSAITDLLSSDHNVFIVSCSVTKLL